jgi:hypothetical protein
VFSGLSSRLLLVFAFTLIAHIGVRADNSAKIDTLVDEYMYQLKEARAYRGVAIQHLQKLKKITKSGGVINAHLLDKTFQYMRTFVDQSKRFMSLSEDMEIQGISPLEAEENYEISSYHPNVDTGEWRTLFENGDQDRNREILFWHMTRLRLAHNFLTYYSVVIGETRIRRIIKQENMSYDLRRRELKSIYDIVMNENFFWEAKQLKDALEKISNRDEVFGESRTIDNIFTELDYLNNELSNLIEHPSKVHGIQWGAIFTSIGDGALETLNNTTLFISKIFGNAIGAVRWREGHLYHNEEVVNGMVAKLQPLDFLTEKTPFILTDFFIPGHWGHAALYLGTEEQLKANGMWDHPEIVPYQNQIRKGYVVLEAVRPKTRLARLDHFMNVDEVAIYRVTKKMTEEERYEAYHRAMVQMDKLYDFNFNVETLDKIVCSELVFDTFGKINWKTEPIVGRDTISPDNVSEMIFYQKSPVELVDYIVGHEDGSVDHRTIDDLAENMGFKRVKSGVFKREVEVCKTKRRSSFTRGSGQFKTVCKTHLEDVEYK